MSLNRHISIANAALASGFIDPRGFLEVMREIGADRTGTVEELWIATGRLTPHQLQAVIELIDQAAPPRPAALRDTLLANALASGSGSDESDNLDVGDSTAQISKRRPIPRIDTPPSKIQTRRSSSFHGMPPDAVEPEPEPAAEPERPPTPRGRYEHRRVVGIGGIGEIAESLDPRLDRIVAIKAARPELHGDPSAHRILEREAKIIASLEHPNIIPVYDAGERPGRGPYYVMRRVHQPSLDTVLSRVFSGETAAGKEYNLARLLRYFIQICNAVDYAHDRGVIHCDLKPANILLGDFGDILVVDWGLAHRVKGPIGPRGGTPGFMAPEQLVSGRRDYDARTDVFALGAILYEMVCHRPAFPDEPGFGGDTSQGEPQSMADTASRYVKPPAPSVVSPHLAIAAELDEICQRAVELDPDDRYASARELAEAVEEYLVGTRERERRQAEAERLTEAGDELADRYHEFEETRPELLANVARLRAQVAPWAPAADKQELWNAEDMLAVTDALRVRTQQAASSSYEQALEALANHAPARRGLARLYWTELERARLARNELEQIHYEQLVQRYDDGTYFSALGSEGRLTVASAGGTQLVLWALREQNRRMVPVDEQPLTERPMAERMLAAGSYVIEARGKGRLVSYPVLVVPGAELHIDVDIEPATTLEPDEVLIPGGRARLGGSPLVHAEEPREVDVPTFAIGRYPVTFEAYLAFVDDLRRRGDPALEDSIPASSLGAPFWRFDGSSWVPAAAAGALGARSMAVLPAFGVAAASAELYARWLSERTGRHYRLPTDDEWEKAARGTDGRAYPWGDHFDATFCKMRNSRAGTSLPEVSGAFEFDESPYGVRDMAGGVADWTLPATSELAGRAIASSRGGSWLDGPLECVLAARRTYGARERSERVGFRLVRSVMFR